MKNLLGLLILTISIFTLSTNIKAQSALNASGKTIRDSSISYAYSIGEVSGFSVQPYCTYTQGVIQPARFLCAPVKYDYSNNYEIALYPNPTKGIVIIETDYPDFSTYKIFSSNGQLVRNSKFTYSPISLLNLPDGFYFLQLFSSDNTIIKSFKIIKL